MQRNGSIWGKVLGGLAGFLAGGPAGAMLGALAGHGVDRFRLIDKLLPPEPETRQISFTVGLVTLAAKMARVDGAVGKDEVQAFQRIFYVPCRDTAEVRRLFAEAQKDAAGFEPYAEQLAEMFADSPGLLEELLEALFIIGRADGPLSPAEQDFLQKVAALFRIDELAFRRVQARHELTAEPHHMLGVAADAPAEDIKAAYRRLIRENHPDTLIAQGLPQDFVDRATRKMAAINGAYERLRKERGFS